MGCASPKIGFTPKIRPKIVPRPGIPFPLARKRPGGWLANCLGGLPRPCVHAPVCTAHLRHACAYWMLCACVSDCCRVAWCGVARGLGVAAAMDPEMQRMLQQMSMGGGGMGGMGQEVAIADTAETVHISSLALLKMLKHGGCHACSSCRVQWRAVGGVGLWGRRKKQPLFQGLNGFAGAPTLSCPALRRPCPRGPMVSSRLQCNAALCTLRGRGVGLWARHNNLILGLVHEKPLLPTTTVHNHHPEASTARVCTIPKNPSRAPCPTPVVRALLRVLLGRPCGCAPGGHGSHAG